MQGVSEYQLANGLQVLLAPNDLQTRVYANLVVKAGSAVEGFGEGGMAHLLEHLIFKGTPTVRDPVKEFADRTIDYNGTTSLDRTNYFGSMNPDPDKLNWYLGWLADASMNSLIAKADLDKEMTVVRNEFERNASRPTGAVYQARMALAFPNHGYGRPTIGVQSTIENVNIERLQAFYKTWYRPDNMVLVVTGQFDTKTTLAHIQTVFGGLKIPAVPLPSTYTREPPQDGVREATVRRVGANVSTLIGWRGAPRASADDAVLDVIASSLANSGGGRFKQEIEKQSLGTQVWAAHNSMQQNGVFDVGLQVNQQNQLDTVQQLLLTHIASIAESGVTPQELARAKTTGLANREATRRSAREFGELLADNAAAGDWRLGFWYDEQLAAVTTEATQRVARAYLVDANRVRVSFMPDANPNRAKDELPLNLNNYTAKAEELPIALPLQRFEPTFAEIGNRTVRFDLPIGTKAALLPRPAAGDVITGTLRLRWGHLASLRGWGVAPYFGGLLLKGTTTQSEAQMKDELSRLQSSLSLNAGPSGMTVGFTTTRKHWRAFARLMQDVVRNPKFDEAAFQVWQQEAIANVRRALDSPEARANNALRRAMSAPYAHDDPRYQPTQEENLARWQALKLDDIKRFWNQFAGASVSEFAAAGALDIDVVKADVAKMLDGWQNPGGAASYQRIARPLFMPSAQTLQLPTPDKPNALMYAATNLAVESWSRESAAMELANGILGGSSSSRLYTKVRKQEGLSYDVGSYVSFNEDDKTAGFGLNGIFAPSNKTKFETAVQEVMDGVRTKGLSSVELFFAKRVAADRIKQALASDSYVASELAAMLYKSRSGEIRDVAWYEAKQAMLQSLTIDEIDAAIKKLLDTSHLVRVFAGDFK